MKFIRFVVRAGALLLLAFFVSAVVLAVSGCTVPFVERPSAEVVLVPAD